MGKPVAKLMGVKDTGPSKEEKAQHKEDMADAQRAKDAAREDNIEEIKKRRERAMQFRSGNRGLASLMGTSIGGSKTMSN